jgi:hypothetical protein
MKSCWLGWELSLKTCPGSIEFECDSKKSLGSGLGVISDLTSLNKLCNCLDFSQQLEEQFIDSLVLSWVNLIVRGNYEMFILAPSRF